MAPWSSTREQILQLLGLLTAIGALVFLAPIARIPYPILMVLGGLALSFMPGLPDFELPPDVILVAFLPPLLYSAAFFTSLRDLRANVRPIGLLSIGLVGATTVVVAVVAHSVIDGLPWAAAFVLGAVVSPTDPLAATAIARRLGVPRRTVTIVEGESLVNDATALVLYRAAVVAAVTGAFSLWESGARLVVDAAGGIAIGLGVGYVVRAVRRRMNDSPSEITIAFLTGYLAYLPAEALGVSAVLAAVTVGIYMGWFTPELTDAETRIQGFAFWTILVFILNAALFTLVGLQLPGVLDGLEPWSTGELVGAAVRRLRRSRARPHRLGVLVRKHSAAPAAASARASGRRGSDWRSSPGPGCAAPSRSPPHWRSRSRRMRACRSRAAS